VLLSWLLIIELVLLAVLGVMGVISIFIARQDASDPVYVFCRTFWNEFLFPPEVMPTDSTRMVARSTSPGGGGGGGGKSRPGKDDSSNDDAFYGRITKDARGQARKSDLTIFVAPHAAGDNVLGRDNDGALKVQVIGEAGESRSNKALVEMVANVVGVKPFQVTLTKGHYQTRKTVQISGLSPDELEMKLASLAEAE
jgi:uncharacterized protein YggU (UPF0235/DUF167 family)